MSVSLLSIRGAAKSFGAVKAIGGIDLDIEENEFFALLGASGSGKTTLLRMLAGFEMPDAGQIILDGKDISRVPPNHRPVNLMFQSYALFPHMSVAQNISYGLEMEKLPKPEIKARVADILEVIQLSHLSTRRPEQLSGGQRQRVALARALVKRPRLLLLDEPLGALDKKLRGEMQLELKRIQDEFGITFVIVTHDQEEALVMADRVAILQDGKLLQSGTPREIYEQPSSRFAAGFIGVMNFIPVHEKAGRLIAEDGSIIATESPLAPGQAGVAAVRPERLSIEERPGNSAVGTVVATAYHGLDLQVHIKTPIAEAPIVMRLTADIAETRPMRQGERVTVYWSARDTRAFPL